MLFKRATLTIILVFRVLFLMAVLGVLVALSVLLEVSSATSLGVVSTEGGLVSGQNLLLGFFRYMDVFKGIPFADIPGRFEKPKQHPGWSGG
ncbi:bile salt-activated lipase-like [Poecilia reticulata]|uniref:bile salt-activated lipase-like n=1 Tax=Poecilia reticulata TaxID=8081 RepID=UPI0007EBAA7B|nr:PREDICTED: bile salt-activated lipase-like [Poecilia reticulata]